VRAAPGRGSGIRNRCGGEHENGIVRGRTYLARKRKAGAVGSGPVVLRKKD